MGRLTSRQLNRRDQTVYDQLKAKVEHCDHDKLSHNRDLEVNGVLQLINLVIVDALLLCFEQVASLGGVFQYNNHQNEVQSVEQDRDEEFHSLNINRDIECRVDQVDGSHHQCDRAQVLPS